MEIDSKLEYTFRIVGGNIKFTATINPKYKHKEDKGCYIFKASNGVTIISKVDANMDCNMLPLPVGKEASNICEHIFSPVTWKYSYVKGMTEEYVEALKEWANMLDNDPEQWFGTTIGGVL